MFRIRSSLTEYIIHIEFNNNFYPGCLRQLISRMAESGN